MTARTLITVPMKPLGLSKTRLSGALHPAARTRLAHLLFTRTLAFLRPIAEAESCDLSVVTSCDAIRATARGAGFAVISEGHEASLNGAAACAAQAASEAGYGRLCLIPADLAAPDAKDVRAFLKSDAPVTICPSLDRGTNALLLDLPSAFAFRFGPRSALRHFEEASARGLTPRLMPLESLSFDIDTTAHLARAARIDPAFEVFA